MWIPRFPVQCNSVRFRLTLNPHYYSKTITTGTFLFAGSLALGVYALLTLGTSLHRAYPQTPKPPTPHPKPTTHNYTTGWSTSNEPTLTVDGAPTDVFMRMGPFGMKARVNQGGTPAYTADSYLWCAKADPGPIFNEPTHEEALCDLLTGAQIAGMASLALGLAALFLGFLLSCNSVKNRERKHVSGLLATLMFFQTLAATGCVAAWVCLHQIAASDLDVTYPSA